MTTDSGAAAATPQVVRQREAKQWYEGDELCTAYREDSNMVFGTSVLEPGKTGAVDVGHKAGKEVFFCARGEVLVEFSAGNRVQLRAGDAVIIPEREPHTLTNTGGEQAMVVWSLAPSDIAPVG